MAMTDPNTQDAGADTGSEDTEGTEDSTFVIEVTCGPDGISVGVESAAEEASESGEGSGDEDNARPVANIKEAMALIKQIYDAGGTMPSDGAAETDQLQAGYQEGQ
jgi:hypothetical protein